MERLRSKARSDFFSYRLSEDFLSAVKDVLKNPELTGHKKGIEEIIVLKALELTGAGEEFSGVLPRISSRQLDGLYRMAKGIVFRRAAEVGMDILCVDEDSRVLIITDDEKKEMAGFFIRAARMRSGSIKVINIDDEKYGGRPLKVMPEDMKKEIEEFRPSVSFYIASCMEGEITFRGPLIRYLVGTFKTAHAHSPGLTERMMAEGMLANHDDIVKITEAVYRMVRDADRIEIETPAGTRLKLELEKGQRWILDHTIRKGEFGNLPVGELFTCPKDVEGIMVVDGALGDYFQKYGELKETPVRIKVKKGRAVDVMCKNKELEGELKRYLAQEENSNRVGELGIGTNINVKGIIGNLLQDEKFPGAHIAFGDPFPERTGVDWKAQTHIDGVMRDCTIKVVKGGEEVVIMRGGKFTEVIIHHKEG